jgi:Xaa-Pro aminopeptidase
VIHTDRMDLAAPRRGRWEAALAAAGIDAWLLTTSVAVRLTTGKWSDAIDRDGEMWRPIVAAGSPVDEVVIEAAACVADPTLIDAVADVLPRTGRVAVDRLGPAALAQLEAVCPSVEVVDASPLLGETRRHRDEVEVATILEGNARAEAALLRVLPLVRPGITERQLAAAYHQAALECGLVDLHVDTVWCALPDRLADAPWVAGAWTGWSPYRELTDDRALAEGDHVCFDGGFLFEGYMVDVGWTVLAGRPPTAAEWGLASRWAEVAHRVADALQPGATAADARRAALAGWPSDAPLPWPYPLYVAHGVGLGGVEPPFAGTDLGPEAEAAMPIEPGQVILVEPYVWQEGVGGYRAELCVVITDEGPLRANGLDVGRWPAA